MILLKSENEIAIMREGGRMLAAVMAKLKEIIKPAITTAGIDRLAEDLI